MSTTKQKSLKTNSVINVLRQICAVLFPLITFPYATRVLGTENYGKVSFGASIISCIALVACLGVIEYAVREGAKVRDNKEEFNKLASQIFSINLIATAAAYLILIILILFWPKLNGYAVLLLTQSICVISVTLGTDWINTVYEDYLFITVRYIACHIIALVLMFTLVHSPDDYIMYAFACVSTDLFAGLANFIYVRKKYDIHPTFTFDLGGSKHIVPIMILFGSTVASFIYINSDIVILGSVKDENAVGIYSAASKIYLVVKQILNAALAVTIPRVANYIAKEIDIKELLTKIRTACLLILLPASAGLMAVSSNAIILLSGEEYADAGPLLGILAIALFFATSGCFYISVIMIPFGKEKGVLIGTIISAAVNIILNLIFIPFYGYYAAAVTTVISEVIMLIVGIICTRKIIRFNLVKPYIASAINIVLIFIIKYAVDRLSESNTVRLFLTVILSIICVGITLMLFYNKEARPYFNKLRRPQ